MNVHDNFVNIRDADFTTKNLLVQQHFTYPFVPCNPCLPSELWMYIFELVVLSPFTQRDISPLYHPFTATALRERDWELAAEAQQSLNIKQTSLGLGIADGVEGVAPTSRTSEDHARWVRSLEITGRHNLDYDPTNPTALLPLLARSIHLSHDTAFPTFTALRRIDWWLPIQPRAAVPFHDLLGQILTNAPKLEYLTLGGGERTFGYASETANAPAQPVPVSNANVTHVGNSQQSGVSPPAEPPTLRLECKSRSALIAPTWVLPSLRYLILGADYFAALPILSTHGHLISTLEILQGVLRDLLEFCPNLEEVAFNTDQSMTLLGDQKPFSHPTLRTVRLKLGELQPLNPNLPLGVLLEKWSLDKLERVILYGSWDAILDGKTFELLRTTMKQRGVQLLSCDGRSY
ncbi:hypothetical protein BDQ17DRAFT_1342616 [Cyathus striatus]|nr:hypothetical protein BDQ17DRAFT_1342616 [Cyathus striatus]